MKITKKTIIASNLIDDSYEHSDEYLEAFTYQASYSDVKTKEVETLVNFLEDDLKYSDDPTLKAAYEAGQDALECLKMCNFRVQKYFKRILADFNSQN